MKNILNKPALDFDLKDFQEYSQQYQSLILLDTIEALSVIKGPIS